MNVGVFDSGSGGRFVVEKLKQLLPQHNYVRVADTAHAPYGERSYDEIMRLTDAAIQPLLRTCPIIVLACNTATAATIDVLREKYPSTVFVGFEPMIKSAATQSRSRHMTLLATHATQYAPRTEQLIARYAPECIIDRPNTSGWARSIDEGHTQDIDVTEVKDSIERGSDSIIIGCTHYIALMERLQELAPHAVLYEPTEAVAREISRRAGELPQ